MGCADLVPGISGGTMAFLLGIYAELIDSIAGISKGKLLKPLKFLLPLGMGMLASFLLLGPLIHAALQSPELSKGLYLIFFALLLLATRKTYGACRGHRPLFFVAGALCVGLTRFAAPADLTAETIPLPLFFVSGTIAVIAMLLPGISGSTLLLICGMYPPLIRMLSAFSLSLRSGFFNTDAFLPLICFGCGALLGALFGARLIDYLLSVRYESTLSLLIGFMAGGAYVLWPLESTLPPLLLIGLTFLVPMKKAEVL